MNYPTYHIDDTSSLLSPSMIVFREYLDNNLDHMLAIARSADRLRPHCKTHKMAEIVKLELAKGIRKHKAATFAEAEMLADAGAKDICLAYNLVGPNQSRAVVFRRRYPDVTFSVTADDEQNIRQLSQTMAAGEADLNVLLDLDTGQHRTGLPVGDRAAELYRLIDELPNLNAAGFHVYDGHQHQSSFEERKAAVDAEFQKVLAFRDRLAENGLSVPTMVCGGTGSFPVYATYDDPAIELSPGTCIFGDANYGKMFPDLEFPPAAVLLTRVISRPTSDRITLDLGYKAVASDPPAGKRVVFPALPDAQQVLQNEEHLVLETSEAGKYSVGDELIAVPWHVCPTSALHQSVYVVENGKVTDNWTVTARNRKLTI
jgi:D-serine deaminase-like pyridoxal phosphate-dependent protein